MTLTADHLRGILLKHEPIMDLALEQLFPDPVMPMNLDALRVLAENGQDVADVLAAVILQDGLTASLEAFLAARGITLIERSESEIWDAQTPGFSARVIAEPEPRDFPLKPLGIFATRASAFRCRIEVDGRTEGSGAFISKRLVLTAAHVIDKVTMAREAAEAAGINDLQLPEIIVKASDGKEFPARCVWYSPVHKDERNGGTPPNGMAETHKDVALLRVGLPLGMNYGYCELPEEPVDWTGPRLMTLVHYPDGMRRGLTTGRVQRDTPGDFRLDHTVDTMGGSSGGLAFDRDLQFIGIHQGRWDAFRRLVPHPVFAKDPGFEDAMRRDAPRRYLWSLEEDIDKPLIIGRQKFFAGLAHMLDQGDTLLRGIWVRRVRFAATTGLSFSFDMLKAFLKHRTRPADLSTNHHAFRIATDLEELDLIGTVAQQVLGNAAVQAHAGVRAGETSSVAQERDRAVRLAQALQARAAQDDTTYWLFFEPPPDDTLSDAARTQFEHLAEWLVTHDNLRIVLAGFEQYAIDPLKFQTLKEVPAARKPGLLVDPVGPFTDEDIRVTLGAILSDLNREDNIHPVIMDDLISQVTRQLRADPPRTYAFEDLPKAIERIREIVKSRADI